MIDFDFLNELCTSETYSSVRIEIVCDEDGLFHGIVRADGDVLAKCKKRTSIEEVLTLLEEQAEDLLER